MKTLVITELKIYVRHSFLKEPLTDSETTKIQLQAADLHGATCCFGINDYETYNI
jgi:hypothetical protein